MKLDVSLDKTLGELVADEGLTLLSTEVVGGGPKTILRLVIDGPDGVTLDQCATVSRQAAAILDVEDPISHTYTLEVSSPGLDRKLYAQEDYEKFAGRSVKIKMQPGYRAHPLVVGELVGLEGTSVAIRSAGGELLSLPLDQVFEARLEVDWKEIMKKGKNRP